jgi:HAD superfamily hydrolase (TIGR01509 family)
VGACGTVTGMNRIEALVLDLDGVVRHFDAAHEAELCRRHGLEPGSIAAAAYRPDLLDPVITGRTTKAEWIAAVGEVLGRPEAAEAWGASPTTVDHAVLGVVDDVRATGRPVVVLTNGTDTIDAELAALDLVHRFDGIFNSAVIGHAKPDPRAFAHVCEELGLAPERVAFADDSPAKLAGATELGMTALVFTDAGSLRAWLVALDVLPG